MPRLRFLAIINSQCYRFEICYIIHQISELNIYENYLQKLKTSLFMETFVEWEAKKGLGGKIALHAG